VEWLLATHESGGMRGPVDWSDETQRKREGLDLRGADLRQMDLVRLPLAGTRGGLHVSESGYTLSDQRAAASVRLENANLWAAQLEGAVLRDAHLEGVDLQLAHLERANLRDAHVERAHLGGAHLEGAKLGTAYLQGAHLWDAHLEGANLRAARLEGANFLNAYLEGANLPEARLEGANLQGAHLEGTNLRAAHLEGANLQEVHLAHANLRAAHLDGANLQGAHLESTQLPDAEVARIRVWEKDFPQQLLPADLSGAYFNTATSLAQASLGSAACGGISLVGIRWGGVDLSAVEWGQSLGGRQQGKPFQLGDERVARRANDQHDKPKDAQARLAEFKDAVRANRQLATVLKDQGLNEDSDRFAYRAQVLQREVFRRQSRWGAFLWSGILDDLAGYGYKPERSVLLYVAMVMGFAAVYYLAGPAAHLSLSPLEALVFSITSFHGRGFSPGANVALSNPLTVLAAVEAILGLLVEITFIATFTQRFFAR
jgi:uncharacterized protein YjbI with pentapeptide repeats